METFISSITLDVHITIIYLSAVVLQVCFQQYHYELIRRELAHPCSQHIPGKPAALGCDSSCSDTQGIFKTTD